MDREYRMAEDAFNTLIASFAPEDCKTCTAKKPDDESYDPVNSPYHYTSGKFECIDVMEDAFGPEEVRMFCKLNAFKYLWRAAKKDNYIQDLKKARWYLDKCIKLTEGKDENSNTLAGEAECNRD